MEHGLVSMVIQQGKQGFLKSLLCSVSCQYSVLSINVFAGVQQVWKVLE